MAVCFSCSSSFGVEPNPAQWLEDRALPKSTAEAAKDQGLSLFDASLLTMEGHPFSDTLTSYSRIPVRYKKDVTPGVWNTGSDSAGVAVRFVTDSPDISLQWDNSPPMVHMAWTGSGGLDLYARENESWKFVSNARPTTTALAIAELRPAVGSKFTTAPTEYLLFLPLYSKVTNLKVAVTQEANIAPAPERYENLKPIVFYGTSITQGGCASRAGMAHPAILRRWLDHPVINLGFSGAGKCEPVMAEILSEIPATLYVIETVSNMSPEMIRERVVPFVQNLRSRQPDTPILMVESPNVDREPGGNAAFKEAYEKLKASGAQQIHYLAGEKLYNGRENPTVDGSHPTDMGFYEMALAYEKVIKDIMQIRSEETSESK